MTAAVWRFNLLLAGIIANFDFFIWDDDLDEVLGCITLLAGQVGGGDWPSAKGNQQTRQQHSAVPPTHSEDEITKNKTRHLFLLQQKNTKTARDEDMLRCDVQDWISEDLLR